MRNFIMNAVIFILFLVLLPYIGTFLVYVIIAMLLLMAYLSYKIRRATRQAQQEMNETWQSQEYYDDQESSNYEPKVNHDIIDAEYNETEE